MTPRRLAAVIAANAMMRVAGGASGMLVGVYAADLANRGLPIDATIAGMLAAVTLLATAVGARPGVSREIDRGHT